MIKQDRGTGTGSRRLILRIREPPSSAFIRDTEPKQGQTNPRDLDAEMMTRLPVATAFDSSYLLRHLPGAADTLCGMALADGRSPLIELHLNVNFSGCAYRQRARDQQNVVFGGRPGSDK